MNEVGRTLNLNQKFIETFGRPPKESELAELMKLQRKMEGWREETHKKNQKIEQLAREKGLSVFYRGGKMQAQKKPDFSKRPKRGQSKMRAVGNYPSKMPLIAQQMDRAMRLGVTVSQLAYIFEKDEPYVNGLIETWKMPVEWGQK